MFSIIIEWMSNLPKHVLDKLDTFMYDDMCHLSKYSKNPVRSDMNDLVKKFNSMRLLIDKFHFKVSCVLLIFGSGSFEKIVLI